MLLAIDLHKDLIDEECVTVTLVLSIEPPGIFGAELVTPESDRFVGDSYSALGQQIFNEWSGTPAVAVTTRLRLNRWYSQTACEMISGGGRPAEIDGACRFSLPNYGFRPVNLTVLAVSPSLKS
jgi:hypothetical protein